MNESVQPLLTHPALKDMLVRVSIKLGIPAFSLLVVFLDFVFSQRMTEMVEQRVFPLERLYTNWRDFTGS